VAARVGRARLIDNVVLGEGVDERETPPAGRSDET
jgi:hypothetical protein